MPSEWQPIKNCDVARGTYVLVALIHDGKVWRVSEAAYNGLGWYNHGGSGCHWRTHWMPMPPLAGESTHE